MYDPELQMRFVRSSTDAFLEFSKAAMAAAEAWQREVSNPSSTTMAPTTTGFEIWTQAWQWWLENAMAPVPDFWRNSRSTDAAPFAWPWMLGWPTAPYSGGTASFFDASSFGPFAWPMRMMPWSFYQGPLMGMMLSSGMPYAVAAPAARASTSAMDAADAAQQQLQLMFASYRNDSGYAASRH